MNNNSEMTFNYGCTNNNYDNYDSSATIDYNSCVNFTSTIQQILNGDVPIDADQPTSVSISGIDGNYSIIKMTSGEVRKIDSKSMATIGILSNPDQKNIKIGKAGRSRWLGKRPHTRGVVKNPVDHPHGGGEGKSAGGRHPVSPTGQSAKGLKTRDNKRTDKFIIRRRKKKRV